MELAVMNRISLIKSQLQSLRGINGVENIFLAQRDGYPVTSAGVWLRPDEIFGVSAASSAIFSVVNRLHEKFNYTLIEGERAKFLIIAFPGNPHYFLSLTAQTNVNLGVVLQFTQSCSKNIYSLLQETDILPPLRSYNADQSKSIIDSFDSTGTSRPVAVPSIGHQSFILTEVLMKQLQGVLDDFVGTLHGVDCTFVSLNGGYPISTAGNLDAKISIKSAFTFALFDTCRKVAWLTKRMHINQVTIDLGTEHHFIYSAGSGIFSTILQKNHIRLGYLRLLIPNFITRIKETLNQATYPTIQPKTQLPLNRFLDSFFTPFSPQLSQS
jgi:predicted regulator of Ras-like GTPase activity (Roadblock/LC7/MglB family)